MAEDIPRDSDEAILRDFDEPEIYSDSRKKLFARNTRNFVVQFGRDESKISFNLNKAAFGKLLNNDNPPRVPDRRPVRWMQVSSTNHAETLAD